MRRTITQEQRDQIIDTIKQIVEDECYDMTDTFNNELLQLIAYEIATELAVGENDFCVYVVNASTQIPFAFASYKDEENWDYVFKVHNSKKGSWISCSTDECTGVSDSVTCIFDENVSEELLKDIVDMINESWYLCQ